MDKFLKLIVQRRIWAGLVGAAVFIAGMFGVNWQSLDIETLTDLLGIFGNAVSGLITSALALHSYFYPKT